MSIKTYDPAKILFSFGGSLITGFGPDTFITVERNEDGFTLTVGAAGEAVRTKSNNHSGKVTVTLLASSQSNDFLSAIAVADELAGTGVAPLFGKEFNGTTTFAACNAWVQKIPNIERAKEEGTVQWVFECADLEMFNGGLLF